MTLWTKRANGLDPADGTGSEAGLLLAEEYLRLLSERDVSSGENMTAWLEIVSNLLDDARRAASDNPGDADLADLIAAIEAEIVATQSLIDNLT